MLQEGKHLLEICHQMNKGICFNINQYLQTTLHRTMPYLILDYFIFVFYFFQGENFKALLQEKEYN